MSPKDRLLMEVAAGLTTHFNDSISAADLRRLPVKVLKRFQGCLASEREVARWKASVRQPWQ
jgi:hypothetical protein